MRHPFVWIAATSHSRAVSHATASAEPVYATLYATCAALMIAVLVVFYFDKRIRDRLTARQRGYAIGSLGGVIGTGLLLCLFVLAGITADTASIRIFITIYTLAFLTLTFGAAINAWGREDARGLQQASAPQVAVPPVPIPRGAPTERERAAELVAAALFVLAQASPAVVIAGLQRNGPLAEKERLRLLTDQWMTLQPPLIAIAAWYPSQEVAEASTQFIQAGHEALKQSSILFANPELLMAATAQAEWQEAAEVTYAEFAAAWEAFNAALNAERTPISGLDT
jgi:hypothetical protein